MQKNGDPREKVNELLEVHNTDTKDHMQKIKKQQQGGVLLNTICARYYEAHPRGATALWPHAECKDLDRALSNIMVQRVRNDFKKTNDEFRAMAEEVGIKRSSLSNDPLTSMDEDAWDVDWSAEIQKLAAQLPADAFMTSQVQDSKFVIEIFQLVFGHPQDTALGLPFYMKVAPSLVRSGMNEGIAQIQKEISEHGTDEDKECLHYCLHEKAGQSQRAFPNGVRDQGRSGEDFNYFCEHEISKAVNLEPPHVLALRLYSTACYKSINGPLRDTKRQDAHPLAVTVAFVDEGVRRLRAIGAQARESIARQDLWRGMRNASVPDDFLERGGTELAPMSTTTSLAVALMYSASKQAVLLRLSTSSFMERGADISFLSAFPAEKEVLYPPLTFMRPTGLVTTTTVGEATVKIIEVVPSM